MQRPPADACAILLRDTFKRAGGGGVSACTLGHCVCPGGNGARVAVGEQAREVSKAPGQVAIDMPTPVWLGTGAAAASAGALSLSTLTAIQHTYFCRVS